MITSYLKSLYVNLICYCVSKMNISLYFRNIDGPLIDIPR